MGCAPADAALATQRGAIVAGAPSTHADDAVVILEVAGLGECTATLVRPNLLLTARHCVSESDRHVSCAADGTPLAGARIHADVPPESVHALAGSGRGALRRVAGGARILHDGADNLCGHDLAFVLLDQPVQGLPVAPLKLTPTAPGELLSAVGWGLNGAGFLPDARQRREVHVIDVGPSALTPARMLLTGEATCQGDSGGPLLDSSGAVVAVTSYGGHTEAEPAQSACAGGDMVNVFSVVAGFPRLVREALARAEAPRDRS